MNLTTMTKAATKTTDERLLAALRRCWARGLRVGVEACEYYDGLAGYCACVGPLDASGRRYALGYGPSEHEAIEDAERKVAMTTLGPGGRQP